MAISNPCFPAPLLNTWYQANKRELPWRRDASPYRVWVSEIMLQQTQVQNVIPYYEKFMSRFPTLQSLAKASEDQVLQLWSGLGYYSRARNLLKTAKTVMDHYNGKFPDRLEDVLKLSGIGPYTAGAILSIAFNQPLPILDGNVRRVLSRFFLIESQNELWKKSRQIVLQADQLKIQPRDFNQALMELGALICLPKNPLCSDCPIQNSCAAKTKKLQDVFPKPAKKQETIRKKFVLLIAVRKNGAGKEFMIRRRSNQQKWLKNLWEFPMMESVKKNTFKALSEQFSKELGIPIQVNETIGTLSHSITKHRLKISVVKGVVHLPGKGGGALWVPHHKLSQFSSSSILTKALALLPRI